MKPFLRRTDRGQLAPVGWVAEPAGKWAGREVDVVYDPRRHDVTFLRHRPSEELSDGLRESGYRRVAVDGNSEMWVRDRLEVVRRSLERADHRLSQPTPERSLGAKERTPRIGSRSL